MSKIINNLLHTDFQQPEMPSTFNVEQIKAANQIIHSLNIDFDLVQYSHDVTDAGHAMVTLQKQALKTTDDEVKEKCLLKMMDINIKVARCHADMMKKMKFTPFYSFIEFEGKELTNAQFDVLIDVMKATKTIIALEFKASRLEKAGHLDAAEAIRSIVKQLNDELDPKKTDLETTLRDFKNVVNQVRPELEKHRDNNYLVANVVLAILTGGLGYLVAILLNKAATGNFLFFSKTDSMSKVDTLEMQLDNIATNATLCA